MKSLEKLLSFLFLINLLQFQKLPTIVVYSQVPKLLHYLETYIPKAKFKLISTVSEINKELHKSKILIADVDLLVPVIYDISNIKWVQVTRGGVNDLVNHVKKHKPITFPVARHTGPLYATLLTEYTLHQIIHYERDISAILKNNTEKVWSTAGKIRAYRIIPDLTFGMLGVGSIGLSTECLHYFGAKVYGFRRNPKQETPSVYKKIFYGKEQLPELLKLCDYIISTLPETKHTVGLLNDGTLKNCKDTQPVFINIGRGSIIDDEELINALKNKWLRAAILDVFNTEPLPKDHPLWTTPNVTISPHVAAYNRPQDIAVMFKTNLKLYEQRKPLNGVIDFTTGY